MARGRTWIGVGALVAAAGAAPVFAQEGTAPAGASPGAAGSNETCDEERPTVVEFATGSAKLSREERKSLRRVADWVKEGEGRFARVEAFTDNTGDPDKNRELSDKRARSVEKYLERSGVDADRVQTHGRGEGTNVDAPAIPDQGKRIAIVSSCKTEAAAMTQAPEAEPLPPEPPAVEAPPPIAPPPELMPVSPHQATENAGEVTRHAAPGYSFPSFGLALSAGGGVVGFTQSVARDATNIGGTWDVRLTLGTHTPLGLDLAYVGSVQDLNVTGLADGALAMGNGAEADLRLQWPKGWFRPFIFGGIGWTHYSVQRSSVVGTGLRGGDDVGQVPFGLGLVIGQQKGLMFELRGTGRYAFSDDLLVGALGSGSDTRLHSWSVTARLGATF